MSSTVDLDFCASYIIQAKPIPLNLLYCSFQSAFRNQFSLHSIFAVVELPLALPFIKIACLYCNVQRFDKKAVSVDKRLFPDFFPSDFILRLIGAFEGAFLSCRQFYSLFNLICSNFYEVGKANK